MAKKETIIPVEQPIESVKQIESDLIENGTYIILFQGAEVEVSGNIANILIKRGKAKLI